MLSNPGIYVHFPWCVRKCPYCDFNSHPLKAEHDKPAYVQALCHDLQQQLERWRPDPFASAFLGGGTPSLFSAREMQPLMRQLPMRDDAEVTMETNPGTMEYTNLAEYRALGVNRMSIGAQSFNDEHLKALGRIHGAREVHLAFQAARAGGFDNINIDLMWGLPGQTPEQALSDLEHAIALSPEHISWYQLTIEPRTEFARRTPILPVEDAIARIEELGLARLQEAGYARYEVSAFARAGRQCAHNLNYWRFGDYIGIGAGAHGKISDHGAPLRTSRPRQPRLYLQQPGRLDAMNVEAADLPLEYMMNALRLVDGVGFDEVQQQTGLDWSAFAPTWQHLQQQGLVRTSRCATTSMGLRYLDSVVAEFIARKAPSET